MKIHPTDPLIGVDREPIKDSEKPETNLTVRDVVVVALLGDYGQQEPKIEWKDKMERFDLATKIKTQDEVDVNATQMALIEKLLAWRFPPLIVGGAHYAMDKGQ